MKPFTFSLEPVLTLQQHKQQMAREAYAGALRACEATAARLQAASAELTGCWRTLNDKLAVGVAGLDLLRARAWCNVLELRVKDRARELEQARQNVDHVWQKLMLVNRERETLEQLRRKRLARHTEDCQREEQKNLDELAVQMTRLPAALRSMTHAGQTL